MLGLVRPLMLLQAPFAAAVDARQPVQDPPAERVSDVEATLLELGEIQERLTVPIQVGARGPYNFVIDTGAERTVVSRELARSLGLVPAAPVMLVSMTSRSLVDTVRVPQLTIRSIGRRHDVIAPALEARNLGAVGLLGIDTLQEHAVAIDFERGVMAVRPARKRRMLSAPRGDEIVIRAKNVFGQLIVTDAYYGGSRIQVVLDTGSQVSMGNSALREKVARRLRDVRPIALTSVTGGTTLADYAVVPGIRIGTMRFGSMPIAFADVLPFERFGLAGRPALLLGMDALRSFRRVEIDFPNKQVRFVVPDSAYPGDRGRGTKLMTRPGNPFST